MNKVMKHLSKAEGNLKLFNQQKAGDSSHLYALTLDECRKAIEMLEEHAITDDKLQKWKTEINEKGKSRTQTKTMIAYMYGQLEKAE